MDKVQLLSIELGGACNMSAEHTKCPCAMKERWATLDTSQKMTVDDAVHIIERFYNYYGFNGAVAFHYYNEPLLYLTEIRRIVTEAKRVAPRARFCLWTNGALIPHDHEGLYELGQMFDYAYVTPYTDACSDGYRRLLDYIPHASISNPILDDRLNAQGELVSGGCGRMFAEFIVDWHGNVHVCCVDYSGRVPIGNALTQDLGQVIVNWKAVRSSISGPVMRDCAPEFCRRCTWRSVMVPELIDKDVYARARQWVADRCSMPKVSLVASRQTKQKVGMVAVAYAVPESRIVDFRTWNHEALEAAGVDLYVVTDRDMGEGSLVYPSDMPVNPRSGKREFSLCMTKNYGVRQLIDRGYDAIIATDIDICWPGRELHICADVQDGQAIAPVYRMAEGYAIRSTDYVEAPGAIGSVAMTAADWARVHYDERCIGYGSDDGILWRAISLSDITQVREVDGDGLYVYHIAHDPGSPQSEFLPDGYRPPRSDHWGRGSGFNPSNFSANDRWLGTVYDDPSWGLGGLRESSASDLQ